MLGNAVGILSFRANNAIFLHVGTRPRGVGSLVQCYGDLGSRTIETLSSSE